MVHQVRGRSAEYPRAKVVPRVVSYGAVPASRPQVSACLCNLSLSEEDRVAVATRCVPALVQLSQGGDREAARQAIGTLANLAEDIDTHDLIAKYGGGRVMSGLMRHDSLSIYREASRAIANLLSTVEHQAVIIEDGLSGLKALAMSTDPECQYHAALSFRKLSPNLASHRGMCYGGSLKALFHLLIVKDFMTRRQAATALRDLCAHADHKTKVRLLALIAITSLPALCFTLRRREFEKKKAIIAIPPLFDVSIPCRQVDVAWHSNGHCVNVDDVIGEEILFISTTSPASPVEVCALRCTRQGLRTNDQLPGQGPR